MEGGMGVREMEGGMGVREKGKQEKWKGGWE